jgi:hypothetical protein
MKNISLTIAAGTILGSFAFIPAPASALPIAPAPIAQQPAESPQMSDAVVTKAHYYGPGRRVVRRTARRTVRRHYY